MAFRVGETNIDVAKMRGLWRPARMLVNMGGGKVAFGRMGDYGKIGIHETLRKANEIRIFKLAELLTDDCPVRHELIDNTLWVTAKIPVRFIKDEPGTRQIDFASNPSRASLPPRRSAAPDPMMALFLGPKLSEQMSEAQLCEISYAVKPGAK